MNQKNMSNKTKDQRESKLNKSSNINKINYLKSDYFIQKFFEYIHKRKSLEKIDIIKISKKGFILILMIIKKILKNIHQ